MEPYRCITFRVRVPVLSVRCTPRIVRVMRRWLLPNARTSLELDCARQIESSGDLAAPPCDSGRVRVMGDAWDLAARSMKDTTARLACIAIPGTLLSTNGSAWSTIAKHVAMVIGRATLFTRNSSMTKERVGC